MALRETARSAALSMLSTARAPAGRRSFVRACRQQEDIRINVGAGKTRLPNWVNTDLHWQAEARLDLLLPWPREVQGRVSRIYADNVIEHFDMLATRQLLRHALVALRPAGRIRLATPDVEAAAREYLARSDLARRHLQRNRDAGFAMYHDVDLLRGIFNESGHHLGYLHDEASLRAELERAGFRDVLRVRAHESADPAFEGLETRASATDAEFTLVLEATKV